MTAFGVLGSSGGRAESRPTCYLPGETIDAEVFVLDAMRHPLRLLDVVRLDAKAVVLVIFGGAYLTTTDKHGGIWCEDSLDDFALQKAAVRRFSGEGVQFVGVACPPVYSDRYGYDRNVFLDEADDAPKYLSAVERFVERTESLRRDQTIPLPTLGYDPRFRLLWNPREHPATPAYGPVPSWQGKFRWHEDKQRYGTPCIWFLDRSGKVLRDPLYGNNYSASPPHIAYTYWELEAAIRESLGSARRSAAGPSGEGGESPV
jgi:hypothetical protein